MKSTLAILAALALSGCASTSDYDNYLATQSSIQVAKANAEAAKYQAVTTLAGNDTTAKVVAMFILNGAGQNQQASYVAPPRSTSDSVREWAGILIPSLMQGYGIFANTKMGMRQSDNATALGMSTNDAFVNMAGQIQAPAASMTIGGSGVIGAGSYSTDNHAIDGSYNPATTDNSNQGNPVDNSVLYPAPAP